MFSFDIFDTLITRCTATPKGIFMLMQERIVRNGHYGPFLANNFYELRIGAEKLARVHALSEGKREVTLDDIYKALSTTACITEKQQEELKSLEIETECKCVLGIAKNIDFLKQLVNRGEHVVLISDMYLGEKIIRYMLVQIDSIFHEIPVYVSSDYDATKGSGELFHIVKSAENLNYSDWTHYGDNVYADVEAAERLGIKAVQLVAEAVKEYEEPWKDLYHQLSVGASKYIRICGVESVAEEVGCSLAGPILYPYVKWVLEKSLEMGINRLYFVARDGWILQQIADKIIQIENYQIKTHYIYGSRKAWRLPSYDGSIEDFDRILRWSNMDEVLNLKDFAEVLQLEEKELIDIISPEYRENSGGQRLLKIQKDNISRQLRENVNFRNNLVQRQKENRDLVIRYLRQEMDISDDKFAFVELAGTGFTQKCLAGIIGDFYQGEIRNFYFKLDFIQENGQCRFFNFFPSVLKRGYMLELLCRAPHGQTESYMEREGRIEPVFEAVEGEKIRAYGLEAYRSAVLSYVEQIEQTFIKNELLGISRIDIAHEYIRIIAENPPERIAEFFCHMPFSSGGRKNAAVEFAPSVTKKQLRKIYFWKDAENPRNVYQGNCLDYALAVCPEAMRYREKCQLYRKNGVGKWLTDLKRYLCTHQKPGTLFYCPWEVLHGNIVIYGAGKVGQDYVKQARQRHARCTNLLWVDKNYAELQKKGFNVESPREIDKHSFDRIIVAIHNNSAKQEIGEMLREMGVEIGKIYYG